MTVCTTPWDPIVVEGDVTHIIPGGQGKWNLDETRLHNKANEIDNDDDHADAPTGSIFGDGWVLPKQDAGGNTIEGRSRATKR